MGYAQGNLAKVSYFIGFFGYRYLTSSSSSATMTCCFNGNTKYLPV